MNALAPAFAPAPAAKSERGQPPAAAALTAMLPLAPGAWLLLGRADQPPPIAGIAQLERRRADHGQFRAMAWADTEVRADAGRADAGRPGGGTGVRFIAAVRLPAATEVLPGQALTLEGEGAVAAPMRLPGAISLPLDFAAEAARLGRDAPVQLLHFLLEVLPQAVLRRVPAAAAMLAALLGELATQDGYVELMGAVPGGFGFLQGWGGPLGGGEVEAVLAGPHLTRCRVRAAWFARPDIAAPASGVVLVLPPEAAGALAQLEQVFLLGAAGVLCRKLAERRLLTPLETSGHVRDLLPGLHCPPETIETLRQGLRPRFEGRETLGEQGLPVRAAVDLALVLAPDAAHPAGAYLTGWLFDPDRWVAEVHLRGGAAPSGRSAGLRLDRHWTRVPRPDVTEGLTRALDLPVPARHEHGFAVYAEGSADLTGALHLDIAFRDGSCAFLPVSASRAEDAAVRRVALETTDMHKPSGTAIVERQLGPLFTALLRRDPPPAAPAQDTKVAWRLAVVVPLLGEPVLPRSVLSQFLHDALGADEGLVFVCGAAWDDAARAGLRRLAAFMGLPSIVVHAEQADSAAQALDIAAAVAAHARLLLLADPATAGCAPGWRAALCAALDGRQDAVACPTLVYEDFSVHYAGAGPVTPLPAAPYVAAPRAMAGMPRALIGAGPPRPVAVGTLTCCLVPRAVLAATKGAGSALATPFGQEIGFFQRLQAAAMTCLWVPGARVFAVEPAARSDRDGVGRLVDGWCLRAATLAASRDAGKGGG